MKVMVHAVSAEDSVSPVAEATSSIVVYEKKENWTLDGHTLGSELERGGHEPS